MHKKIHGHDRMSEMPRHKEIGESISRWCVK